MHLQNWIAPSYYSSSITQVRRLARNLKVLQFRIGVLCRYSPLSRWSHHLARQLSAEYFCLKDWTQQWFILNSLNIETARGLLIVFGDQYRHMYCQCMCLACA